MHLYASREKQQYHPEGSPRTINRDGRNHKNFHTQQLGYHHATLSSTVVPLNGSARRQSYFRSVIGQPAELPDPQEGVS